jgi:hypothetical protein
LVPTTQKTNKIWNLPSSGLAKKAGNCYFKNVSIIQKGGFQANNLIVFQR